MNRKNPNDSSNEQQQQQVKLQQLLSNEECAIVAPYITEHDNLKDLSLTTKLCFEFDFQPEPDEEDATDVEEYQSAYMLEIYGLCEDDNEKQITKCSLSLRIQANIFHDAVDENVTSVCPIIFRLIASTVKRLNHLLIRRSKRIEPEIMARSSWGDERPVFTVFAEAGYWSQTLESLIFTPCCWYPDNADANASADDIALRLPTYFAHLPTKPTKLKYIGITICDPGDEVTVNGFLKLIPNLECCTIIANTIYLDCFNLLDIIHDLHLQQNNNICHTLKSLKIITDDPSDETSLFVNDDDIPEIMDVLQGFPNLQNLELHSDHFKSSFIDAVMGVLPKMSSLVSIEIRGGETVSDRGLDMFLDHVSKPNYTPQQQKFEFDFDKLNHCQRQKMFERITQSLIPLSCCSNDYFVRFDKMEYQKYPNRGHDILDFLLSLLQVRCAFQKMDVTNRKAISPYKLLANVIHHVQNETSFVQRSCFYVEKDKCMHFNSTDVLYALLRQRPEFLLCNHTDASSTASAAMTSKRTTTATAPQQKPTRLDVATTHEINSDRSAVETGDRRNKFKRIKTNHQ